MNLKETLRLHKLWINDQGGVRADLHGADLTEANLSDADLRDADLRGANLSGTYLTRTNLSGADLTRANLRGANLTRADLHGADLHETNLRGADLTGAYLGGAYLSGAIGLYQFGPMPTSGRLCYAVWHTDKWMVQAGCFWGDLDELDAQVKFKHKCPVYLANIALLRSWNYE